MFNFLFKRNNKGPKVGKRSGSLVLCPVPENLNGGIQEAPSAPSLHASVTDSFGYSTPSGPHSNEPGLKTSRDKIRDTECSPPTECTAQEWEKNGDSSLFSIDIVNSSSCAIQMSDCSLSVKSGKDGELHSVDCKPEISSCEHGAQRCSSSPSCNPCSRNRKTDHPKCSESETETEEQRAGYVHMYMQRCSMQHS